MESEKPKKITRLKSDRTHRNSDTLSKRKKENEVLKSSDPSTSDGSSLEIKHFKRVHDVTGIKRSLNGDETPSINISPSTSPTGSREKLIYTPFRDGQMNENKQSFDRVNFCFSCDWIDPDIKIVVSSHVTLTVGMRSNSLAVSQPNMTTTKRPRSTSAILSSSVPTTEVVRKKGSLKRIVERTGYKLSGPVYRVIFLCPKCVNMLNESKLSDCNFYLKISSNALAFF